MEETQEIKPVEQPVHPTLSAEPRKRKWHEIHKIEFVRVLFLFAVSYILLFVLMAISVPAHSALMALFDGLNFILPIFWPFQALVDMFLPLWQWGNSPMYYLVPIPGFFLMYYLIDWMEGYFKFSETEKKFFPVVFWLLVISSYFLVLMWYFHNMYQLSLSANPALVEQEITFWIYMFGGIIKDGSFWVGSQFNFWYQLKNSAFLVFSLAAFLGWASRKFVTNTIEGK
jgi:hypothetical protein